MLWLIPAALVAPFARTLHPAEVIDDPALMLSFVSILAAVTTVAILNRTSELIDMAASTALGKWVVERIRTSPHELHHRLTAGTGSDLNERSSRSFDLSSND